MKKIFFSLILVGILLASPSSLIQTTQTNSSQLLAGGDGGDYGTGGG